MTTETDNRVYIPNLSGHNYLDAKRFGTLVALTEGNINPLTVDRLAYLCAERLGDSTEKDYLLLSGHQVINAIAATLLLVKHGLVNYLVYDAREKIYVRRTMTASQLKEISGNTKQ